MAIFRPFRFIHKQEIEALAMDILRQMEQTQKLDRLSPLDPSCVAEFLGLDVVWDKIPDDFEGTIAARILPLERLIEINENLSICRGGFGQSTIAHEIGHWVLHIDPLAVSSCLRQRSRGVYIKVDPYICRNDNSIAAIEWQAQYFATCLLMPEHLLIDKQIGRDLTKWQDLYQIADDLGVTISNLVHRLKDLDWIYIPKNSRQIYLSEGFVSDRIVAAG